MSGKRSGHPVEVSTVVSSRMSLPNYGWECSLCMAEEFGFSTFSEATAGGAAHTEQTCLSPSPLQEGTSQ